MLLNLKRLRMVNHNNWYWRKIGHCPSWHHKLRAADREIVHPYGSLEFFVVVGLRPLWLIGAAAVARCISSNECIRHDTYVKQLWYNQEWKQLHYSISKVPLPCCSRVAIVIIMCQLFKSWWWRCNLLRQKGSRLVGLVLLPNHI